jgi:hypothetical protein
MHFIIGSLNTNISVYSFHRIYLLFNKPMYWLSESHSLTVREFHCYYEHKEPHHTSRLLFPVWNDFCPLHSSRTHFTKANFRIIVICSSLVVGIPQTILLARHPTSMGSILGSGKRVLLYSRCAVRLWSQHNLPRCYPEPLERGDKAAGV